MITATTILDLFTRTRARVFGVFAEPSTHDQEPDEDDKHLLRHDQEDIDALMEEAARARDAHLHVDIEALVSALYLTSPSALIAGCRAVTKTYPLTWHTSLVDALCKTPYEELSHKREASMCVMRYCILGAFDYVYGLPVGVQVLEPDSQCDLDEATAKMRALLTSLFMEGEEDAWTYGIFSHEHIARHCCRHASSLKEALYWYERCGPMPHPGMGIKLDRAARAALIAIRQHDAFSHAEIDNQLARLETLAMRSSGKRASHLPDSFGEIAASIRTLLFETPPSSTAIPIEEYRIGCRLDDMLVHMPREGQDHHLAHRLPFMLYAVRYFGHAEHARRLMALLDVSSLDGANTQSTNGCPEEKT